MYWRKRAISTLLVLVGLVCLVNIIDLPYEIRFIKQEFNYLFVGGLYIALALLIMLRILLIEDVYTRRTLLVVASMLIVFPSLFIFSISLQQYYRVKSAEGVDVHLMLIKEAGAGKHEVFIRHYNIRDQRLTETYGFGLSSKIDQAYSISHPSQANFPTKRIIREERALGKYLKVVKIIQG